ncbi:hypothetical protein AAFF_G00437270 [Aldrovandia affinis]|uniref:Uncharacterized protein n=1 Tax=Aldrovandia affinis TaxID=143900 RepID=A0AAD7WHP3_9TELE|nr:hypothetical protein AAFF_G00437270 [Aldrovandia affinis]
MRIGLDRVDPDYKVQPWVMHRSTTAAVSCSFKGLSFLSSSPFAVVAASSTDHLNLLLYCWITEENFSGDELFRLCSGTAHSMTNCLLSTPPSLPFEDWKGNAGQSEVFACSQCPFVHSVEVKLHQHIEKEVFPVDPKLTQLCSFCCGSSYPDWRSCCWYQISNRY